MTVVKTNFKSLSIDDLIIARLRVREFTSVRFTYYARCGMTGSCRTKVKLKRKGSGSTIGLVRRMRSKTSVQG